MVADLSTTEEIGSLVRQRQRFVGYIQYRIEVLHHGPVDYRGH